MKLRTKGKAININEPVVKRVTRSITKSYSGDFALLIEDDQRIDKFSGAVITTNINPPKNLTNQVLYDVETLDHIMEGDIVSIQENGQLRTMYRVNSDNNALLVTERCNSNCLMCSQPPKDNDDINYYHEIHKQLIPLIPKDCQELIITGGEPTLLGNKLIELLQLIKYELPKTEVHMLTNGRSFSIFELANRLASINYPQLMLGIPLYSDYYQIHDFVVQKKHAFYQTVSGIYNLKRFDIKIEIRIVLHKITIPRLTKLANYIFKNLPFVDHVAFMGLEITGFTRANLDKLWIDPVEYIDELVSSVKFLHSRKINVSIYNTPLCLLPEDMWQFARKSISDWKNIYFEECSKCDLIEKCGGLFESSSRKYSDHIKAIRIETVPC